MSQESISLTEKSQKEGWLASLARRRDRAQDWMASMVLSEVPVVLVLTAAILTLFGVVMVLSASSVEQISAGYGAFTLARSQAVFAALGLITLGVVGYLIPVTWYRRPWVLNLLMLLLIALLLAVMLVGTTVNGNRNWINIGGMSLQPSELGKPITILWLALVYTRQGRIDQGSPAEVFYKALIPALLGFATVVGLILTGHDLGTVLIYALFFAAIFMAAGPSRLVVTTIAGLGGLLVALLVLTSPNRLERIINTFAFWRDCLEASCDQANSGLAALATGGIWGVGLGQSRQKYSYLPEAQNDYIFAVVGEEIGLGGCLIILTLYALLIYCCLRIILRSADLFIRYASIGLMTWLVGQALLNIAMVAGIMPVIGVPLPFISAGGSALISSLLGVGLLIAFARQTPMQPLVGQGASLASSPTPQETARRQRLARMVETEQAMIARNPVAAGWTLDKFKALVRRVMDGQPQEPAQAGAGNAAASRPAGQRPARAAAQQSRQASRSEGRPSAPRPSVGRERPSARLQQAQQTGRMTPEAKAQVTAQEKTAQPGQKKGRQAGKPAQTEKSSLPPGLRTIRRARSRD